LRSVRRSLRSSWRQCPDAITTFEPSNPRLKESAYDRQNVLGLKGLWDKREAGWDSVREARNQQYRKVGARASERVRQIQTVHVARHLNVGDDQINVLGIGLQDLESLSDIFGFEALDVGYSQNVSEVCTYRWFVINDKTEMLGCKSSVCHGPVCTHFIRKLPTAASVV